MSRSDALNQYESALRMGKKYYSACMAKGQDPYPIVLDELLGDTETAGMAKIGLMDIPTELIVGTWAAGRKTAFAGNFMPLLDMDTEFASKWINLCEAHLGDTGITDPIVCYEYLGKFYVQEGHKRVSVLKSFDSPSIMGSITRIIPAPSEDPAIQQYTEFMQFFKVCPLYQVTFTQLCSYARLQAALGFAPDQVWPEDVRKDFAIIFRHFSMAFDRLNASDKLPITAGDALLACLQVHPYAALRSQTDDEMRDSLAALWPDIRLLAQGEPISVSTEPEEKKEKSLLSRLLGSPKLHVAFIYDFDPQKSAWASAHALGQQYLEEQLGDTVEISSCLCEENADEVMEEAIGQGANVLFATTPTLISASRRIAAKYKNVAVFNCALSMPYAGVRSYYCRVYESKFIAGAVAGAMAPDGQIGYIANYPIMGAASGINAFALGAQLTNPRSRIHLAWTCLPGNPVQHFLKNGISVISNRDSDGASPFLAWNLGTYQVGPGGEMQSLASPRWNWGIFYEKTVRSILNSSIEAIRDSEHAINDWWGMSAGVVDVDLDSRLPAGLKQLAQLLKNGIIKEEIDPFLCPINGQDGTPISDGTRRFTLEELMGMDWLCDHVEGSIPTFEELLPQSQNLVRLLGIHRQEIPPKTEDAVL